MPQSTNVRAYQASYPVLAKAQKPGGIVALSTVKPTDVPNKAPVISPIVQSNQVQIGMSAQAGGAGVTQVNMNGLTVAADDNAILIFIFTHYSNHSAWSVQWDTFGSPQNCGFILTCDNGAFPNPGIAVHGLLNPNKGNKTLRLDFTGAAADDIVMHAITLKNVNQLGGLSGAFAAARRLTGTGIAASAAMPRIPGGLAIAGFGTQATTFSGLAAGPTQLQSGAFGGNCGITGAWECDSVARTIAANLAASAFWTSASVVINPPAVFPPAPVVIDNSNPIASGLVACVPMFNKTLLTDLVSGKTAVPTVGTSNNAAGGYGGGVAFPVGSTVDRADFGVWQPVGNGDCTFVCLANPNQSTGKGAVMGWCDGNTVSAFGCIQFNADVTSSAQPGQFSLNLWNGTASQGATDAGRPDILPVGGTYHVQELAAGGYQTWGGRLSGGNGTVWCNGRDTTNGGASVAVTGTHIAAAQHFAIGNLGSYSGTPLSAGCTIILCLLWNRALSDAEMASITANPFQVLKTM